MATMPTRPCPDDMAARTAAKVARLDHEPHVRLVAIPETEAYPVAEWATVTKEDVARLLADRGAANRVIGVMLAALAHLVRAENWAGNACPLCMLAEDRGKGMCGTHSPEAVSDARREVGEAVRAAEEFLDDKEGLR